ncbi:uncharacterized protein LOC110602070 [Manihot esculenta]|nr:uncharacterized protein LOC110602070 [Manihot esculenta]
MGSQLAASPSLLFSCSHTPVNLFQQGFRYKLYFSSLFLPFKSSVFSATTTSNPKQTSIDRERDQNSRARSGNWVCRVDVSLPLSVSFSLCKPIFRLPDMSSHTTSYASPIYANKDIHEGAFFKRRCCFWVPFLCPEPSIGSAFWQRINPLDNNLAAGAAASASNSAVREDPWWKGGWRRMREWSEITAGPKWKMLIRKISRKRARQGYGKFHYDPWDYALNFDDGPGQDGHYDEDLIGRGFSSRYSLPPSCKCSMDFEKEEVVFTWNSREIW